MKPQLLLKLSIGLLFFLITFNTFAGGPCTGFSAELSSVINPSCNGGSNGSATVAVSGGASPYTYSWSPTGGTNSTANGLSAGTYTCTITDHNGCTYTVSAKLNNPPFLYETATVSKGVSCFGNSDGCAYACVTGGTPPYTYSWLPSSASSNPVCGLSAGTYTVQALDHNGCIVTASVTMTQPPALTESVTATNPTTCNNTSNGSLKATAGGGTPGYTYSWMPSGGSSAAATGLSAGTYTCTVTDTNGCTRTATGSITQCGPRIKTPSITPATCGVSNGSATPGFIGGCSPIYTYLWTPTAQTNATATGLSAGTYTVNITDGKGCSATTELVIPSGGPTVTIAPVINVTCNGASNGSATATASGGTPPYTYEWNGGWLWVSAATGLSAGTYVCQVTDHNGCVGFDSITITQPSALSYSDSITSPNCKNNNGIADIFVSGGTPGYTYSWSTTPIQTNAKAIGLSAGTYTCNVTDNHGCTFSPIVTVKMSSITVSMTSSGASCNAGNNGSASASASGGSSPYTYSWSSGQTSSSVSNLTAGLYTCTVTDKNGCTGSDTISVSQSAVLSVTSTYTATTCGSNNGAAMVNVSGGYTCSGNYSYIWEPIGANSNYVNGLSAGTYTCTVTDDYGCKTSVIVVIPNSNGPSVSTSKQRDNICYGESIGEATVSVSGGKLPYTYYWLPIGGSNDSAYNLSAGTYTCEVTDSGGCVGIDVITITQPTQLVLKARTLPSTSGCNGTMWVTVSGGTGPYSYAWCTGATVDSVTNVCPGICCCLVTDANGCADTVCAIVNSVTGINNINSNTGATLFPNPATGTIHIKFESEYPASSFEIYDITGRKVKEQNVSNPASLYSMDVSSLADGIYLLRIKGTSDYKILRFTVQKR